MPLIKKIKENNCHIGVWEMSESLDELINLSNTTTIPKLKSKIRKKHFLATRLLLEKLHPNTLIKYNKYGAPEIEKNLFISISHSNNLAAIIISEKKVGLDIEKVSQKPLKISSKFIAKNTYEELTKEKATIIWSCKEAIFKWHQKGGVSFSEDIQIMPFEIKKRGEIIAKFKGQLHTLHYKKIDTHFLVYVCN